MDENIQVSSVFITGNTLRSVASRILAQCSEGGAATFPSPSGRLQ